MYSTEVIKYKYLKHRTPITITKVYNDTRIGLVNGLWANALGRGGILHIECKLTLGQNLLIDQIYNSKITELFHQEMKKHLINFYLMVFYLKFPKLVLTLKNLIIILKKFYLNMLVLFLN